MRAHHHPSSPPLAHIARLGSDLLGVDQLGGLHLLVAQRDQQGALRYAHWEPLPSEAPPIYDVADDPTTAQLLELYGLTEEAAAS